MRLVKTTATEPDATINAVIRALSAAWRLRLETVADRIDMGHRTFHRRIAEGGWTTAEIARIAEVFDVTPGQMYTGDVVVTPPPPDPEPGPAEAVGRMGLEPMRGGEWVRGLRREYGLALLPELAAA